MALPASGAISFNAINVELGLTATAQVSLNDLAVRNLFGVASGAIAMNVGYGKSNRVIVAVTIAENTTNYTLGTAQIPGYVAGKTQVTLQINPGVYVYSTNTANAGLTVAALDPADDVVISNLGYIMGMGGAGGGASNGAAGGPAISISRPVYILNDSYIAGGGGGGGGAVNSGGVGVGGGGGAGGGAGGAGYYGSPGTGGGPGSAGTNGTISTYGSGGGGGGRILPGVGGTRVLATVPPPIEGSVILPGQGGGSGGSGAAGTGGPAGPVKIAGSGQGGNANVTGSSATYSGIGGAGGGGGGWGASGGRGNVNAGTSYVGGAGGKAVNLNGYTVTWVANGTVYGAVS
jgi:hypothetical protein